MGLEELPVKDALGLLVALGDADRTKSLLAALDERVAFIKPHADIIEQAKTAKAAAEQASQTAAEQGGIVAAERAAWRVDSANWMAQVKQKEDALVQQENVLFAREDSLAKREADAAAIEQGLLERHAALQKQAGELAEREAAHSQKVAQLKELAG